jgi:hypothetical protein
MKKIQLTSSRTPDTTPEFYTVRNDKTYIIFTYGPTAIIEIWKSDRRREYIMQRHGDIYAGAGYVFSPDQKTLMEQI